MPLHVGLLLLAAVASPNEGWIDPSALAEKLKDSAHDLRVIDTRDDVDFNRGHIRESLHMPGTEARHRAFLKRHDVVLLYGQGNPCPAMELAERMRADGFTRVRVLEGGMEAWVAAGQPVEEQQDPSMRQSTSPVMEPGALTARELEALLRCKEVTPVILDLDGEMATALKSAQTKPRVTKTAPKAKEVTWRTPVVVVNATGRGVAEEAARLREQKVGPAVFWLEGGVEAWRMWKQARSSLPPPEKCPGCGTGQ
ncbi:MAG: rhodanese-like domain-containing protein [Myxococcota bacterium]